MQQIVRQDIEEESKKKTLGIAEGLQGLDQSGGVGLEMESIGCPLEIRQKPNYVVYFDPV